MKVLMLILLTALAGCRVLKRSERDRTELEKRGELDMVMHRTGVKERDIVRYWPDGRVYELEQVREQVDEAQLARVELQEKLVAKRDAVQKEREPTRFWVYVGIGLAVILGIWVVRQW